MRSDVETTHVRSNPDRTAVLTKIMIDDETVTISAFCVVHNLYMVYRGGVQSGWSCPNVYCDVFISDENPP